MSVAFASERRSLSQDEFEPVLRSHYPGVGELTPEELVGLAKWLRSRRARARDIIRGRRRIASGKVEGRGTAAEASSERGLAGKKQIFANALKRVNSRLTQVRAAEQRADALAAMQAALRAKQQAVPHHPQPGRSGSSGMRLKQNAKRPKVVHPARIGSISQSVRNAQAARDGRAN